MPLPDDVKPTNPYWDDEEFDCEECGNPVEGDAYNKWAESIAPDEDGFVIAAPLLCWECYCSEMGICQECREPLNQDIMCLNGGCDMFGRQG